MKRIIAFILIFLVIGGGLYFLWSKNEKPLSEELKNKVNLTIYAVNSDNGKYLKTDYEIYDNGVAIENGTTLKDYPIFIQTISNNQLTINSVNKTYYNNPLSLKNAYQDVSRAKLNLDTPSPLKIEKEMSNKSISFNLTTEKKYKGVYSCIDYTTSFIFVRSKSHNQLEKRPPYFNRYSKCFELGDLNSTNIINFELEYDLWRDLKEEDEIKVIFADSENKEFGDEEKDYWGENKQVVFKSEDINNIYN